MEGGRPTCFRREHRGIVGLRGRLVPRRTAPGRLAASLGRPLSGEGLRRFLCQPGRPPPYPMATDGG